jgi:tRNA G18 (ribose-2'-O)-methylase SpoU
VFWTVLHNLKSPENVGILVRTHVAFGGAEIVIVGPEPWRLKRRAQAFSRHLEQLCQFVHCTDDDAFFGWCTAVHAQPVAVEIAAPPRFLAQYTFGPRTAIVVGNEGGGLPPTFLQRCAAVLTIPQYGPVACLNTAVAGCLAMYEIARHQPVTREIRGDAYVVKPEEDEVLKGSRLTSA